MAVKRCTANSEGTKPVCGGELQSSPVEVRPGGNTLGRFGPAPPGGWPAIATQDGSASGNKRRGAREGPPGGVRNRTPHKSRESGHPDDPAPSGSDSESDKVPETAEGEQQKETAKVAASQTRISTRIGKDETGKLVLSMLAARSPIPGISFVPVQSVGDGAFIEGLSMLAVIACVTDHQREPVRLVNMPPHLVVEAAKLLGASQERVLCLANLELQEGAQHWADATDTCRRGLQAAGFSVCPPGACVCSSQEMVTMCWRVVPRMSVALICGRYQSSRILSVEWRGRAGKTPLVDGAGKEVGSIHSDRWNQTVRLRDEVIETGPRVNFPQEPVDCDAISGCSVTTRVAWKESQLAVLKYTVQVAAQWAKPPTRKIRITYNDNRGLSGRFLGWVLPYKRCHVDIDLALFNDCATNYFTRVSLTSLSSTKLVHEMSVDLLRAANIAPDVALIAAVAAAVKNEGAMGMVIHTDTMDVGAVDALSLRTKYSQAARNALTTYLRPDLWSVWLYSVLMSVYVGALTFGSKLRRPVGILTHHVLPTTVAWPAAASAAVVLASFVAWHWAPFWGSHASWMAPLYHLLKHVAVAFAYLFGFGKAASVGVKAVELAAAYGGAAGELNAESEPRAWGRSVNESFCEDPTLALGWADGAGGGDARWAAILGTIQTVLFCFGVPLLLKYWRAYRGRQHARASGMTKYPVLVPSVCVKTDLGQDTPPPPPTPRNPGDPQADPFSAVVPRRGVFTPAGLINYAANKQCRPKPASIQFFALFSEPFVESVFCTFNTCPHNTVDALCRRLSAANQPPPAGDRLEALEATWRYLIASESFVMAYTIAERACPVPGEFDSDVVRDSGEKGPIYHDRYVEWGEFSGKVLRWQTFEKLELSIGPVNGTVGEASKPRVISMLDGSESFASRCLWRRIGILAEAINGLQFVDDSSGLGLTIITYIGLTMREFQMRFNAALSGDGRGTGTIVVGVMGDDAIVGFVHNGVVYLYGVDMAKAESNCSFSGPRGLLARFLADQVRGDCRGLAGGADGQPPPGVEAFLRAYLFSCEEPRIQVNVGDDGDEYATAIFNRGIMTSGSLDTAIAHTTAGTLAAIRALLVTREQRGNRLDFFANLPGAYAAFGISFEASGGGPDGGDAKAPAEFCGHFGVVVGNTVQFVPMAGRLLSHLSACKTSVRTTDLPAHKRALANAAFYLAGPEAPLLGSIAEDHNLGDVLCAFLERFKAGQGAPVYSDDVYEFYARRYEMSVTELQNLTKRIGAAWRANGPLDRHDSKAVERFALMDLGAKPGVQLAYELGAIDGQMA